MKRPLKLYFQQYFATAFCVLLACSCKVKVHNKAELLAYINNPDHGLYQKRQISGMDISLTYHPIDLMMPKDNKKPDNDDTKIFINKYYFVLGYSSNGKELLKQLPFNQYSELVQIFAFRMKDYVLMKPDNGKAVEPVDCIFQQTYGMSDENEIVLVFDKTKLETADHVMLTVKEFGLNTGNLNFALNIKDISNTPSIN